MGVIFLLAPVCSSHFHIAISISIFIRERSNPRWENFKTLMCIILADLVGAGLGNVIIYYTINFDYPVEEQIAMILPPESATHFRMFLGELVGIFMFVTTVAATLIHRSSKDLILNCLNGAFILYGCLNFVGGVSGGCINPGIGLVQPILMYYA